MKAFWDFMKYKNRINIKEFLFVITIFVVSGIIFTKLKYENAYVFSAISAYLVILFFKAYNYIRDKKDAKYK